MLVKKNLETVNVPLKPVSCLLGWAAVSGYEDGTEAPSRVTVGNPAL